MLLCYSVTKKIVTTTVIDSIVLLPDKVVCPRYFNLAAELCLRWQLLVLQHLVNGHLVALAVRVHLGRHLVREQVEVSPGQLHVGQWEHTYSSQTVNIGFNDFFSFNVNCKT